MNTDKQFKVFKLEELSPHPRNRTIYGDGKDDEMFGELFQLIKEHGLRTKLIVSDSGVIISGHRRFRALQELGYIETECEVRHYENGNNDTSNVVEEVLKNRGIDNWHTYLTLSENVVIPYNYLDNISEAVEMFMKHFNKKDKIGILVDSDPDGFCSAAMMYLYIKRMDENYSVEYILHGRAKAHGLSEDVVIPKDIKLLIIPDAGTNDTEQCNNLADNGMNILILDHHEKEEDNPYALIVNNQISKNYSNKNLCGAGVVYRFLQALDDENWNEFADDYLDLCALANISDVMDMRSYETRYLTDLGLLNIQNKCFSALVSAQNYSMNGKVNIHIADLRPQPK